MRLSGFVVATILFVSITFQVSGSLAAGGGFSGGAGGSSHSGGSSGGSSVGSASPGASRGSSAGSAGSLHSSAGVSSSRAGSDRSKTSPEMRGPKDSARNSNEKSEKRGIFSFFRHKKTEPQPTVVSPFRCRFGQNCRVCGNGNRNGGCGAPTAASCGTGQTWNGFGCSAESLFYGCDDLARQMANARALRRNDKSGGQSLRYQLLRNQYEQCVRRFGLGRFGAFEFTDASLFDLR
jgi:hypothetical protein